MTFHRPPPPSPCHHHQPFPLEHTSSSSSSIPSLTSDASSSPDSDSLTSPLRQLSLHSDRHSPSSPRKPRKGLTWSQDSALDDFERRVEKTREDMLERDCRLQDHRSIGTDVDVNKHMGREGDTRIPTKYRDPKRRLIRADGEVAEDREQTVGHCTAPSTTYTWKASLPRRSPSSRPALPHRNSSYSKRHASFNTPREVPLPYMPIREPSYTNTGASILTSQSQGAAVVHASEPTPQSSCFAPDSYPARPVDEDETVSSSSDSTSSTPSSPSSTMSMDGKPKAARSSLSDYMDMSEPSLSGINLHTSRLVPYARPDSPRIPLASMTALPLFNRPFSSPDATRPIHCPRPMRPSGVPDRGSTASLPPPADTPYCTLLPFAGGAIQEDDAEMRSTAPTRPSSSRPPHQTSTSPIPSSSSWRTRSPSFTSELEHEEIMSLVASRILDRAYPSLARQASDPAPDRPLPPPAPPTVLTPPPPPLSQDRGPAAPYEPFLAHAPPPQGSFIVVDTQPAEYRLLVCLPGFNRDAITVSTRKRRILHVVADSWEPNGGHFEQRIAFGYDALLAQVRAEFDGKHLLVIVPRRMVPMTY